MMYESAYPEARHLSAAEERACHTAMLAGSQEARERLIESGYAWAVKAAMGFRRRGLDGDDARSFAHCGLVEAVNRFDPARGRLSSAVWQWVRMYCMRELRLRKWAKRKCPGRVVSWAAMTKATYNRTEPATHDDPIVEPPPGWAVVERHIKQLPPCQRLAMYGILAGKTHRELAEERGVGKRAIYDAYHGGLRRLRHLAELDGVTCP